MSSQKILLNIGNLRPPQAKFLTNNNPNIACFLVNDYKISKHWSTYGSSFLGRPLINTKDLVIQNNYFTSDHVCLKSIVQSLMADPSCFVILQRLKAKISLSDYFNDIVLIERISSNVLAILDAHKIERLISNKKPHSLTWFVFFIAELLGLKICYCDYVPPLNCVQVVKGLKQSLRVTEVQSQYLINPHNHRTNYDLSKTSSLIDVPESPNYMLKQMKPFNIVKSYLKKIFRYPLNPLSVSYEIFASFISYRCYKYLVSSTFNSGINFGDDKYVIFFLHFQPERTTHPDGGIYGQQTLAIREIRSKLPEDFTLLVREHPSIFLKGLNLKFRNRVFYETINSLPNTYLVDPFSETSAKYIHYASGVCTITGTVGFESVMARTPTLIFANTFYSSFKHCYSALNNNSFQNFVDVVLKHSSTPINMDKSDFPEENLILCDTIIRNSFPYEKSINGSLSALDFMAGTK